ncbi:DUF397 domain-containing protein [Streptomyces sp. UNOC14_S4]|nr:DUF397 domain-containing protein [Streptomyces sp. UNOC14_S4]
MPRSDWQKSSFCAEGGNNCVEIRAESGMLLLCESEAPGLVVSMTHDQLAVLIQGVKSGAYDHRI